MEIIALLIFVSLMIAVGFLIVFLWNLKSGQYDDTFSPSVRMLLDDRPKAQKEKSKSNAGEVPADRTEGGPSEREKNQVKDLMS